MRVLPTPVRSILAALTALEAVALIGAWGVGRVVTDRYVWSQWLFWIPPAATVAGAVVLLLISRLLMHLGARKRGLGPLARGIGYVGVVAVVLWTGLVEWRYWRLPWRSSAPGAAALRVVGWNPSMMACPRAGGTLAALDPDIVVMNNPPAGIAWGPVKARMGEPVSEASASMITVVSRWPVLRKGSTELGLKGLIFGYDTQTYAPEVGDRIDAGRAAFFEIDARERLGRKLVVWAVDLPSDPLLGRAEMMRQARAAIDGWKGEGFPAPDLIVGDFNTPRGSASLKGLVGDLESAYSQAGVGACGTWPRIWPVFHVDQMFAAGWLRATGYRIVDPGETMHRVQVGEFVAGE